MLVCYFMSVEKISGSLRKSSRMGIGNALRICRGTFYCPGLPDKGAWCAHLSFSPYFHYTRHTNILKYVGMLFRGGPGEGGNLFQNSVSWPSGRTVNPIPAALSVSCGTRW